MSTKTTLIIITILISSPKIAGLNYNSGEDTINTKKTDFQYIIYVDKAFKGSEKLLQSDTFNVKAGDIVQFHLSSDLFGKDFNSWFQSGNTVIISLNNEEIGFNDSLYQILFSLFIPILVFPVFDGEGNNRFDLWKEEAGEDATSRLGRFVISDEYQLNEGSYSYTVKDVKKYNKRTGELLVWKHFFDGAKVLHIQQINYLKLISYSLFFIIIISGITVYLIKQKKQRKTQ